MIEGSIQLFGPEHVALDLSCESKDAVFRYAAELAERLGAGPDKSVLLSGLKERELIASTAVGKGIAVPHCKSDAISNSILLVLRLDGPVLWDESAREFADVVFAIFTNSKSTDHLAILAELARNIMHDGFLSSIRAAHTEIQAFETVNAVVTGKEQQ